VRDRMICEADGKKKDAVKDDRKDEMKKKRKDGRGVFDIQMID
jgi:hypothetical protein